MPPKKKQGKSKSKKKKGKDVDPEEKLRQELLEKALALEGETSRERALEAQFVQQSESLKAFWEIEKKTREEKQRALLEKEHRLKDIKDRHVIDLGRIKQNIKQLLFANQDELSEKTTQYFVEYQSLSDRHQHEVGQLYNEMHAISNKIRETVTSHDRFKVSLRQSCCDEATELQDAASRRIATLAAYAEKQFKRIREEAGARLREETKEAEDRNEATIRELVEKNTEELQAIRTECKATMNRNLDTMTALRREVVLLREQDLHDRRKLNELRKQNNDIVVPLETKRNDLEQLESDLEVFRQQKQDLHAQTQRLRRAEKELEEVEWDREVLFQKLQALEAERDRRKEAAQRSVHAAQQRGNFRNLRLERELGALSLEGEKDTAALAEILQKENIDLDAVDSSQVRVADVVGEKDAELATLRKELKRIKDAHATMLGRHRTLLDAAKMKASAQTAA